MRFEPKSEKEIAEAGLLSAGEYDFEVYEATEKVSKAGNDMVELAIWVYDQAGTKHRVRDWLVGGEKSIYKVSHFAKSVGLYEAYESGDMPADVMVGKVGRSKVGIRKDTTGQYADQNSILDYVEMNGARPPSTVQKGPVDLDDEIPF